MAKQSSNQKVSGDDRATATDQSDVDKSIPDSARTNGELDGRSRETVGEPVGTSFNERTAVRQPFILEDGTQDNGALDLDNIDGAKGESTREGNNTVREDTRQAIEDGVLPASDQPKGTLPGEEEDLGRAKNPDK